MISSSHSVIYRLTPPTCTLEIWGKQSPLSEWTKKEIVKDIHFKLSFDDPALLEEQKVTFSGDRIKLEAIYEGVIIYVKNFLQQSFPLESFPNTSIVEVAENAAVYLKPKGLVCHQLFIQNLETSPINLSTVQLFDLVTALEEYKTKVAILPGHTSNKSQKVIPLWFKGVAGLALVAGLTTIGTKLVQKQANQSESIASVQQTEMENNESEFDDVIPPEIPSTETKINQELTITEPLSSTQRLPPPPAVDTPKPPPDIPDPAKYPIPEGNLVIPPIASKPKVAEKSQTNTDSSQVESKINFDLEPKKQQTFSDTNETKNSADNLEINLETKDNEFQISTNSNTPESIAEEPIDNNSLLADRTNINRTVSPYDQLKEVKAYFKKSWQPPQELKQTVEYRLIINANGSIQRIIPIGTVSEIFIDRTNIPLMGEKFVSPLKNTSQATIRLLLSPDGEVTTILE